MTALFYSANTRSVSLAGSDTSYLYVIKSSQALPSQAPSLPTHTFCFFLSCLALMRESMLSRRLQW